MTEKTETLPRLYTAAPLAAGQPVALETAQAHYLRTVLRRQAGDSVRLFNGRHGEWRAAIERLDKKGGLLAPQEQLKPQPEAAATVHLLFAPLKKNRMDIIIEKATELGVSDFHPVITNRTEVRSLNMERLQAQIIEAAEQSERLTLPALHPPQPLTGKIAAWQGPVPILWARERGAARHLADIRQENWAFLIGPVGGFDPQEDDSLSRDTRILPVSLGAAILRAETASILCLAHARLCAKI